MTLKDFLKKCPLKKIRAEMGGNSHSRRILGQNGEDKKVNVPTGITVYDDKNVLIGKQLQFFKFTILFHIIYVFFVRVKIYIL